MAESRRYDLGIDTASDLGGLALLDAGGAVVAEREWDAQGSMSRTLLAEIDALLVQAGADRKDIARIAVNVGPGQYGALRTGIATAQGLAIALEVPLAGIGRLVADAMPHFSGERFVVPVHETRGGIAWAAYAAGGPVGLPREFVAPRMDTLVQAIAAAPSPATWCGEVGAVSNALAAVRDAGVRTGDTVAGAASEGRAVWLVRLARGRDAFGDPAAVDALYLRPPPITPPRPR